MDKLTKRDFENDFCLQCQYHGEPNGCNKSTGTCETYDFCMEAWDKLAEYEDTGLSPTEIMELKTKLENGTLVELPVAIGMTVYKFSRMSLAECRENKVPNVPQKNRNYFVPICQRPYKVIETVMKQSYYTMLGNYVFLTLEDAEKKLKETSHE